MTRVSLKEAYDNKDVVAQIYAIRDIAEGAGDTANGAVSTANTASEHVDALVPQVEGAVQNANNASASAQTSAQTVAGYENRLSTVESETAGLDSDLGAVTLRVTTAEGQIVTIEGRVTALEGADAQNVKLAGAQNIAGIKTVPTEPTGTLSQQIANSAKVGAELDNYAPMLRTTGNQTKTGSLIFRQTSGTPALSVNHAGVNIESTVTAPQNVTLFTLGDTNGTALASFVLQRRADNGATLYVNIRNANGTYKFVNIASGDP